MTTFAHLAPEVEMQSKGFLLILRHGRWFFLQIILHIPTSDVSREQPAGQSQVSLRQAKWIALLVFVLPTMAPTVVLIRHAQAEQSVNARRCLHAGISAKERGRELTFQAGFGIIQQCRRRLVDPRSFSHISWKTTSCYATSSLP
jgi:hypothetical protein